MKAYQIKFTKPFMNMLLASEEFDTFLVEEVSITTFNTFHIDGHIVKEFYNKDDLTENDSVLPSLSAWSAIRPICFQLIKGKKPPVSFRVVLYAPQSWLEALAANEECEVNTSLIQSLVLNIRYDNGHVTCITGSSFTTFIMDKSVDRLWDSEVKQLLTKMQLDFEEI